MDNRIEEAWVELSATDGHRLDAFRASPRAEARGAVVVVQEIFGVNAHIQKVARALASEGYTTIAPALFDRASKKVELAYDKEGIDRGLAIKSSITFENALLDVSAALDGCPAGKATIVLGFCWGGTIAWLAAGKLPINAAVAYYGGQIGAFLDVAPKAPVMTHFGSQDHSIPLSVSQAVTEKLPTVVNHVYPAGHGFNCDERESFHAQSAALAWGRTAGFLSAVC
jgi:carboxymethylenebutenolidase